MKTNHDQKIAITLELSECGAGQIFVRANDNKQAAAGHVLLSQIQPELRALDAACKAAATKLGLV